MSHNPLRRMSEQYAALVMLLAIGAATGCTAPPNVAPFADATIQLRAAVAAAGRTAAEELRATDVATNHAAELETQWQARDQAMQALTVYAASLQSIVSAEHGGAQAADNVATALGQLAATVGVVPGTDEAVALATDSAKFVYQQIARVRAARSLEKAMVEAQPAVEEIGRLLQADFADLLIIFRAGHQLARVKLTEEYADLLGYRETLMQRIASADITEMNAEAMADLGKTSDLLNDTETWYAEYRTKQATLAQRARLGRQLIMTAGQSAREWAATHQQLVVALRSRKPIDARSLLIAAVELRELVQRAREL